MKNMTMRLALTLLFVTKGIMLMAMEKQLPEQASTTGIAAQPAVSKDEKWLMGAPSYLDFLPKDLLNALIARKMILNDHVLYACSLKVNEPVIIKDTADFVEFADNEKKLITISAEKATMKVWDLEKNSLIHEHKNFCSFVRLAVLNNAKDKIAISTMLPDIIYIVSLLDGKYISQVKDDPAGFYSLVFNEEGTLLAAGCYEDIKIYTVVDGSLQKTLRVGDHLFVYSIHIDKQGKKLAAAIQKQVVGTGEIRIWDLDSDTYVLLDQNIDVYSQSLRFNEAGTFVIAACMDRDRTVRLYSNDGKTKKIFKDKAYGKDPRFNSLGDRAGTVVFLNNRAIIWDVTTGEKIVTLIGDENASMGSIRFNNEGSEIVTSSNGSIYRWKMHPFSFIDVCKLLKNYEILKVHKNKIFAVAKDTAKREGISFVDAIVKETKRVMAFLKTTKNASLAE